MDSNIRAEVVSIGPELVLGQILDKPFPPSELCERAKDDFQADLVLALAAFEPLRIILGRAGTRALFTLFQFLRNG